MKKKFFIKNLFLFLIPVLIPILLLGASSIFISQIYMKDQIKISNTNLLEQTQQNIELIFNEVDSLSLNFMYNNRFIDRLEELMNKLNLSGEDLEDFNTIKSFMNAPAYSRPYIHSIYIYYNNDLKKLLTTNESIVYMDRFYDTTWYKSYIEQTESAEIWVEPREIKQYTFEKPTKVLTLYRKLYPSLKKAGVIVLNIRTEYIEKQLGKLAMFPGQTIKIFNEKNALIFEFKYNNEITDNNNSKTNLSQASYITYDQISKRYGWKYTLSIPDNVLYNIPTKLSELTICLLILSFASSLILTYYLTKKNYKRVKNIFAIIQSAESGNPLPEITSKIRDEYGYIIQNIIKTFIEQSYLKIQLSERKYKLETMELLALQSQINPHFLFNTLETIKWEAHGLAEESNQKIIAL